MSSGVVVRSPAFGARQIPNAHVNAFTAYPYANAIDESGRDDIRPFMARVESPVKVRYPSRLENRRELSRTADYTKTAVFSFKPLRRGEKQSKLSRFRSPDATLPTLQYLSPWISVTKTDYKDPRSADFEELEAKSLLSLGLLRRSNTDVEMYVNNQRMETLMKPLTPMHVDVQTPLKLSSVNGNGSIGNGSIVNGSGPPSRSESRVSGISKSMSTEKRVTIVDPTESLMNENDTHTSLQSPRPILTSPRANVRNVKMPDIGVNYYSGYLPPELHDKIAEQMNFGMKQNGETSDEMYDGEATNCKSIVGDRSLFMRSSYPTQPKIYQSDIDQLRFEGRERLMHSHGREPAHFSALKDKKSLVNAMNKGARQGEATRVKNVVPNPRYQQKSSIEMFNRQREKTYHLQSLAREMLNK